MDPGLLDRERACTGEDRALGLVPVAHDQAVACCVAQVLVRLDVGGDFGFDGSLEHVSGSLPDDFVEYGAGVFFLKRENVSLRFHKAYSDWAPARAFM
jgi:hypothetical protein